MTFDDLFADLFEEEEDDAGLAGLLSDLFPGHEPLLFHLLVCSPCRDRATTGLLARYGTSLVLPAGGLAELLGDGCDADFPIDGWVDELLAHPREHHFDLLDEPRFGDGLLVRPLLERCRREQLREPELAEHLALLAVRLADKALDDAGGREPAAEADLPAGWAPPPSLCLKPEPAMDKHRHLTPEQVTFMLGGNLSQEVLRLTAGVLIGRCAVCLEMIRRRVLGLDEPGIESRPEDPAAKA